MGAAHLRRTRTQPSILSPPNLLGCVAQQPNRKFSCYISNLSTKETFVFPIPHFANTYYCAGDHIFFAGGIQRDFRTMNRPVMHPNVGMITMQLPFPTITKLHDLPPQCKDFVTLSVLSEKALFARSPSMIFRYSIMTNSWKKFALVSGSETDLNDRIHNSQYLYFTTREKHLLKFYRVDLLDPEAGAELVYTLDVRRKEVLSYDFFTPFDMFIFYRVPGSLRLDLIKRQIVKAAKPMSIMGPFDALLGIDAKGYIKDGYCYVISEENANIWVTSLKSYETRKLQHPRPVVKTH